MGPSRHVTEAHCSVSEHRTSSKQRGRLEVRDLATKLSSRRTRKVAHGSRKAATATDSLCHT